MLTIITRDLKYYFEVPIRVWICGSWPSDLLTLISDHFCSFWEYHKNRYSNIDFIAHKWYLVLRNNFKSMETHPYQHYHWHHYSGWNIKTILIIKILKITGKKTTFIIPIQFYILGNKKQNVHISRK